MARVEMGAASSESVGRRSDGVDKDSNLPYYQKDSSLFVRRMPMIRVSSADFLKRYGTLCDKALTEPLAITRNGRDRLVLVSTDMFEDLRRAAIRSRPTEALDAGEIAAIAKARVPAGFDHLNALLGD
jgi:PHD/YefM family antitoxin component YafN of YafNO toxin-antitoxin module